MTALVALVAAFFLGMGLVALCDPQRVTALFGTDELTIDGRNEVRAVYGGFGIAMAASLGAALVAPALRPGVLACLAAALVGMAFGRVVSRVIDGSAGAHPKLFLGVELVLSAMLLVALRLAL